ncbi:MAG: Nudix family hydrolase [Acidiferrobacteraceae bacterium]
MNTVPDPVAVALGIARDRYGRVLSASRPAGKVRAGQWEFPGGKVAAGETPERALVREWREELGVEVEVHGRPYIVRYRYPDQSVVLHVFPDVVVRSGRVRGAEGQALCWSPINQLRVEDFVAADRPVLARLRLPRFYFLSDAARRGADAWLRALDDALSTTPAIVQLREHTLTDPDYGALATETEAVCRGHGADLLFNRDPKWVARRASGGLHLTAAALRALPSRPLPADRWVAASCHDASELARAVELGVDFVTLSPVQPTATHPGAPVLGWETFRQLTDIVGLPVFAQGGLARSDLALAIDYGAHGLALLRGAFPAPRTYPAEPSEKTAASWTAGQGTAPGVSSRA